jgi:TetR/AcrR family transcriptional repressor of nem operon
MGNKGETTKNRVITAARHLFKYQGYKNTTIDDISRASGVKRGNLYFYFRSKEEIAHAAIEDALRTESPFLDGIMGGETDPLKKVELMIDKMVEHIIDRDCKGG